MKIETLKTLEAFARAAIADPGERAEAVKLFAPKPPVRDAASRGVCRNTPEDPFCMGEERLPPSPEDYTFARALGKGRAGKLFVRKRRINRPGEVADENKHSCEPRSGTQNG